LPIDPKYLPPARGKHGLRFSYSQWYPQWEASVELPASPFGQTTLEIEVSGGTAWEPVTEDELALIDRILDSLPDVLRLVIAKLKEYDDWNESLQDPKVFRETYNQPSICLLDRDEHPRRSWTFVVERLAFDGDAFGWHLKFIEMDFQEIGAGD
jgi:hypothetical protein